MKKLLSVFLAGLILLPLMAKSVYAANVIGKKQAALEANIQTLQPNAESFSTTMSENLQVDTVFYILGGHPQKGDDGGIIYSNGMVGEVNKAIAWMLNSPVATTERYIADVLDSAGIKIAQPAYAQGLGFASLDPILDTWKTFRNLAYLLFVVVFLAIGFLIMTRQKAGGQTVITAQQAIPHIIIALILVTFSYAIAGLLIDLMYLVMYLLLALFNRDEATFLNQNFISLGWLMISSGAGAAYEAVESFSDVMTANMAGWFTDTVTVLGGVTLMVVIAVTIALKVMQLFFELLKTYVSIILSIAFSPIMLAIGAIPGKDTFKQWITDLIGNLAAFPVVMLMLIIFDKLTNGISGGDAAPISGGGFQPPYLIGSGNGAADMLPFIVGLGILTIMPEIVKKTKTAMGVKEGIFGELGAGVQESLKSGLRGGELVPGIGATNTSEWFKDSLGGVGGHLPMTALFGNKATRASVDDPNKRTVLGRGLIGGIPEVARRTIMKKARKGEVTDMSSSKTPKDSTEAGPILTADSISLDS